MSDVTGELETYPTDILLDPSFEHQYAIQSIPIRLLSPANKMGRDRSTGTYWAYQWASGLIMANRLATLDGTGKTLLELGPGLGLCSTIAGIRGFAVTAVDMISGSTDYVVRNANMNNAPLPTVINQTWKAFLRTNTQTYDVIAASDVLYDLREIDTLLPIFQSALAIGGIIYIADPAKTPGYAHDRLTEQLQKFGFIYREDTFPTSDTQEVPRAYDAPDVKLLIITRASEAEENSPAVVQYEYVNTTPEASPEFIIMINGSEALRVTDSATGNIEIPEGGVVFAILKTKIMGILILTEQGDPYKETFQTVGTRVSSTTRILKVGQTLRYKAEN